LDESACLAVKNIGKPCAGKPHARFDEGGQVAEPALYSTCYALALSHILYSSLTILCKNNFP